MTDAAPQIVGRDLPARPDDLSVDLRGPAPVPSPRVGLTVSGFAATRLIGNLFLRFPYVFITSIARGLGISVEALTAILGIRELGGLVAPLTGRWFDRGHERRIILVGGVIAGLGCALGAIPHVGWFTLVMVLAGAAKISIDLTHNAWIGHNVPLDRRGRVGGLLEMTWAGAFLAGVPAVGFLIDRYGWQAAFVATGPVLALCALASAATLPASTGDESGPTIAVPAHASERFPANARLRPAVWTFCVMQPLAQMLIFAVNGDWFATTLKLSIPGIAATGLALGFAELVGTGLAVLVVDRVGPLRCGMWAMAFSVIPIIGIIVVGASIWPALALMVVMDVAIEFGFVAVLPLFSELDTANRGKAMGRVFVLIMVSRAIGSAAAGAIYGFGGFTASLIAAAIACSTAAIALGWARAAK